MKKASAVVLAGIIVFGSGLNIPPLYAQEKVAESATDAGSNSNSKTDAELISEILNKLAKAFVNQDLDEMAKYIHKDSTSFDDAFDEGFKGKEAVLNHIKDRFKQFSPKGKTPLLSMDLSKPEVTVKDKTATAKYVAFAEIGGAKPQELSSEITEVFVKEDGQWLSYKYYCHWTEEKGKYLESGVVNPENYIELKGGVKTLLVSLHGIKALGIDVKRARRGLNEYKREASRKKLVVTAPPNEVGPIIEESPDPKDYLPARKEHLEVYLNELATLIKLMKADVDAFESGVLTLVIRKDIMKEMNSLIDHWVSKVKSADRQCKALTKATKKNIDDNALLVKSAELLEADLNELKLIQKKMERTFRKPMSSLR